MPLVCPQCSQSNPDEATSCIQCGYQLQPKTLGSFGRLRAFADAASPGPGTMSQVPFPPQPQGQGFPPQSPTFFPPPAMQQPGMQKAAMQPLGMQTATLQPPVAPPLAAAPPIAGPSLMPPAFSLERGLGSLRRAFAGHGQVVTHQSWLLNDEHAQANEVRHAINEMMAQSGLNELQVITEKLTDQSLVSEQRDFTRIKRKLPTIFIYVTPAGRDLYISRATAVKPAISLIRTGILLFVLAIMLCQLCNLAAAIHAATTAPSLSAYGSSGGSANPFSAIGAMLGGAAALTCLDAPFFGLLIPALVRSLISWIFEKDPWVLLRPNRLNEFQRDDVALLEQVTDDIIRVAVKQLGLDASKIAAPAQGYQPPRKIRLI